MWGRGGRGVGGGGEDSWMSTLLWQVALGKVYSDMKADMT